jgi:transcriptional regulator GlxA family with amidase domain
MHKHSTSTRQSTAAESLPVLHPPTRGAKINVAFIMTEGATMIDFAGPWEVFQDVGTGHGEAFRLYIVSEELKLIEATGGMKIMPDYTFKNAPTPQVIVVPAQNGHSDVMLDWLRKNSSTADVTLSVCAGAFQLARAGILDGLYATTHHDMLDDLAKMFPKIKVDRGARFVENKRVSTAAGLTSGIDLALRIVERYFGREKAERVANFMEYHSKSWIVR